MDTIRGDLPSDFLTSADEEEIDDKPVAESVGWRVIRTERPLSTPWMTIRRDDGYLSDGEPFTYIYVEAAPAVFIVPATATGDVVLIREYRYTVDARCLEIPAGGAGDRPGQSLEKIAVEELREEGGGTCSGMEFVSALGEIRDGQSTLALLLCEERLQETAATGKRLDD